MSKIKGKYIFNNQNWFVSYKVEDGDEQNYKQVMLHPNHSKFARENQMDWFIIKDCPNLHNGGILEPMAIVVTIDKLEEVGENNKGQEIFKCLNDHAMSALQQTTEFPEPEPKPDVVQGLNQLQENNVKLLKKLNMKDNKQFWDWNKIIDFVIILGIIILAALDKEGWGWLLLFLIIKN